MQKNMKKVKCIHNLIPRDKFSMGKPYSLKPHPTQNHASQTARAPHLPINVNPTLLQNELQVAA